MDPIVIDRVYQAQNSTERHRFEFTGEFPLTDVITGLAVTVAKYETPNHKDIHKLGIIPDEVVAQGPISYQQIGTEADLQYQAAVQALTSHSVLAHSSL
jgi:hypothetical protein